MELLKDILLQLSMAYAPSGREHTATEIIEKFLLKYTKDIKKDALGNIIAVIPSKKTNAKKIMLDAHYDEISLMVTNIDDDGFVKFTSPFGVDIRSLLAKEVIIHGVQEVFGIVSSKPPHLLSDEEMQKAYKVEDLAIDIGFNNEKANKLINIGDSITFKARTTNLKNDIICGKSVDNRAGVTAIIGCLELLKNINLEVELIVLFSVQEEAGTKGAKVGAYTVNPDTAIVVDVSHAFTPDASKDETGEMGKGVMIGISPILKREISAELTQLAKENEIPFQTEVMSDNTGTNAASIQIARSGIPTGLISIPLKYMHSPCETVMLSDIECVSRLLAEFVKGIREGETI